jgi:hypothetical protein
VSLAPDGDWDDALAALLAAEGGKRPASPLRPGAPPVDDAASAGPDNPAGADVATEPAPPDVAVLVFGVGDAELLAALLKGPQIGARTLAAEGMGLAVLDHAGEVEALAAARTASATLKGVPVFLLRRGPTEDPSGSDIQGYLYVEGEERQRVSPGLALAQSPQLLEDLLIDPEAAEAALARAVDVNQLSAAEAIAIIGRNVGSRPFRKARRRGYRQGGQSQRDQSGRGHRLGGGQNGQDQGGQGDGQGGQGSHNDHGGHLSGRGQGGQGDGQGGQGSHSDHGGHQSGRGQGGQGDGQGDQGSQDDQGQGGRT